MFSPATVISAKRDGEELSARDLCAFADGVADGSVSDGQIGAFTMAVYLNGMSDAEQAALTLAMRDTGTVLQWHGLDGPVLDKHSTGGVGDLVSIVMGPLMAACGAYVPMISGRGLGHTGGTLDKLESIPGYKVQLPLQQFQKIVHELGISIVGQGPELAPADRRMYAVRDVTATVSSEALIVSSILSKKLSEGLGGLVMDIKVGSGAVMRGREAAGHLARNICAVAAEADLPCIAVLTDMEQPLATSVGNALEMSESMDFLAGNAPNSRLQEVVFRLCAELLALGGIETDRSRAEAMLRHRLDSGAAAERFAQMVAMHGGPADLLEAPAKYFQDAPVIKSCFADSDGYILAVDARKVGACVHDLGGGRLKVGDTIDARVGVSDLCSLGQQVVTGQPLARIHAASEAAWHEANARLRGAISISGEPGQGRKLIIDTMGSQI